MKKLVLICLFFCSYSFTNAQTKALFEDRSYDETLKLSKSENKPMVIMFYATWCAHCNKMKSEVLKTPELMSYYQNTFVCMGINAEGKEGLDLKNKFKNKIIVKAYPTFVFMDSNENVLNCISGEFKVEEFMTEAKNALNPALQFSTLKNAFYSDVTNAENCIKYIIAVRKAGLDATKVAEAYLNTKKPEELYTEANWKIMANGINNIDAPEIKLIANNQEAFAKVSSPIRVEKKLVFVTSDNLRPLAETLDTINYYKRRLIAESFHIRKVDSLLFQYDVLISENTKNWKAYRKAADANVEKYLWKNATNLVEVSTNYLNHINDKTALDNAIKWSLQALTLGESLDKYLLVAKLYQKQKNLAKAIEYAEKGKTFGSNLGWKIDEFDKLLNELKKK